VNTGYRDRGGNQNLCVPSIGIMYYARHWLSFANGFRFILLVGSVFLGSLYYFLICIIIVIVIITGSTSSSPYTFLLAVYHRKLFAFCSFSFSVSFNLHLYNLHMQQNIICFFCDHFKRLFVAHITQWRDTFRYRYAYPFFVLHKFKLINNIYIYM